MPRLATHTKQNARQLRHDMTDAEQLLWRHLRMRQLLGLKFRRQHPVGSYILDFACLSIKLAIELDGGQHADASAQDAKRSLILQQNGWQVLRFWNHQVLESLDDVLALIFTTGDELVKSCHTS
ncbi:MAG: endonuclease domain-containing protein [Methylophilus sp.]|jgi:very-short-patch-repair endonuclease